LQAPHGKVKLLDFGLARFLDEDVRLTPGGMIVGTPSFMAPEQARGETGDARSDLYSLGVVLYCLCTGRTPFEGKNTMALLTALAVDTPRPVHELNPAIPRALSDLVMQLLAKGPAQRPASAEAVLQRFGRIEACLADSSTPTLPSPAAPALFRAPSPARLATIPARRSRAKWLLALVGVAVLAVGAWLVFFPPTGGDGMTVAAEVPGAFYLSNLEVIDPVNWPFPGRLPGPPAWEEPADWPPPQGGRRVCVRGRVSPRGIFMHLPPPNGGTVRVSYQLGKRFSTFNTAVSLNDGPPRCIPLTFAVYGDGRRLWESKPVASQPDGQSCLKLSVWGVDRLTLEVRGQGDERGTHAVWIEPYLTE
jgi:hypothetical protein